jgi:hypothetical protein
MNTQTSAKSVIAQVAASLVESRNVRPSDAARLTKPAVTDSGKIKIGGAALSLIKSAKK